jgi:AraC-like DNA-binding protein
MDIIFGELEDGARDPSACVLTAVGAMTRYLDAEPLPLRIGVRFRPGMARRFLCAPAHELTDREVALTDLWGEGGRALQRAMADAGSVGRRLHVFEGALRRRLERHDTPDDVVRRAVERIVSSGGAAREDEIVSDLGVGARQLRRRFAAAVGLSPKRLGRIVRLQGALRVAAAGGSTWSDVAVSSGYYDQAHMIADFRTLTGRTPSDFSKTDRLSGAKKPGGRDRP